MAETNTSEKLIDADGVQSAIRDHLIGLKWGVEAATERARIFRVGFDKCGEWPPAVIRDLNLQFGWARKQ